MQSCGVKGERRERETSIGVGVRDRVLFFFIFRDNILLCISSRQKDENIVKYFSTHNSSQSFL